MNTALLKHVKRHRGEFNFGLWRSNYLFVGTSPREVIRDAWRKTAVEARQPQWSGHRKALYAGTILGIRRERRLMKHFAL